MSRNGKGNGLPYHIHNNCRRQGPLATGSIQKGLSPAKFLLLIGLCIISLLAVGRVFTPGTDDSLKESLSPQSGDELEREQIVQQTLDTRKSAYRFEDFEDGALSQPENEHLLPATAVLLGWERVSSLKLIVSYLARYPYIKQIIIWNNNRDVKLSTRDFVIDSSFGPPPELQVYNAAENLHDLAKYMSCSLAKYQYCYFQDDDWLNTYMDTLYTNFLSSPNLIHTNTQPLVQMENRRWTFSNKDHNMHSGFTWMGTGSYLPKSKAKRLLEQQGNITLAKDRFRVIDMYFSVWTNQYPYQLTSYLTPVEQKNGWGAEGAEGYWGTVFRNMLDAADRLYSALIANVEGSNKGFFTREEEKPYTRDRHVRSPCHNDKCLFMTSIDPFPDPKEVVFKGDLHTIDEQNEKFKALDYPTAEFWKMFSYVHAVDNDPLTCWNSFKAPQAGDSFGLKFVKPVTLKQLKITSSKVLVHLEGKVSILVSNRKGEQWVTCHHTARFPFAHTMMLNIACPPSPTLPNGDIQMVKVQIDVDQEKSLEICSMDAGGMLL